MDVCYAKANSYQLSAHKKGLFWIRGVAALLHEAVIDLSMKLILILSLSLLFGVPLVADEIHLSSIYLIKDDACTSIKSDVFNAEANLEGLNKVTILGYVRRPGVYYFKGNLSIINLIHFAGDLRLDSGGRSSANISVVTSSKIRRLNLDHLNLMLLENPQTQTTKPLLLKGDEVVYRGGLLGL